MAKFQARTQGDGPEDGLREKMISINRVNKVLYMVGGHARMFGPRDAVLAKIAPLIPAPPGGIAGEPVA